MQKLKQTLIKIALLSSSLAVLIAITAQPARAADFWTEVGLALVGLFVKIVGILVNLLKSMLLPLLTDLLETLFNSPNYLFVEEGSLIQTLWEGALGVANGFFLLALIIASVAIILRVNTGTYNIKKVLGGFIAAVVLSNLSLLIFRALLEAGQKLTDGAWLIFSRIGLNRDTTWEYIKALGSINVPIFGERPEAAVFVLIMVILIFWVLLKLALILIERIFWLFVMAVIAPVAFALGLLPTTQKLASSWWETTIKWILVFPLTIALVALSVALLQRGVGSAENLQNTFAEYQKISELAQDPKVLLLIAGMVVMYLAGTAGKMLKIGGPLSGAGIVATPGAMVSGAQKMRAQAYKGIADTITGKNLLGRQIGRRSRDVWNLAQAHPWGKQFEGLRISRRGGRSWKNPRNWFSNILARVANPTGEKARTEIERTKDIRRSALDAYISDAKGAIEPLNKAAQAGYGKDWNALDDAERELIIEKRPGLKRNSWEIKEIGKQVAWRASQAIKDMPSFMTPNIDDIVQDVNEMYEKPGGKINTEKIRDGKIRKAIENMAKIMADAGKAGPKGQAARVALGTPAAEGGVLEAKKELIKRGVYQERQFAEGPVGKGEKDKSKEAAYEFFGGSATEAGKESGDIQADVDNAYNSVAQIAEAAPDVDTDELLDAIDSFKTELAKSGKTPAAAQATLNAKLSELGITDAGQQSQIATAAGSMSPAAITTLRQLVATERLEGITLSRLVRAVRKLQTNVRFGLSNTDIDTNSPTGRSVNMAIQGAIEAEVKGQGTANPTVVQQQANERISNTASTLNEALIEQSAAKPDVKGRNVQLNTIADAGLQTQINNLFDNVNLGVKLRGNDGNIGTASIKEVLQHIQLIQKNTQQNLGGPSGTTS